MPTKLKGKPVEKEPQGLFTKLMDSGHQVFLAGLGAAARIINEGPKLFESLAQEGAAVRERGRVTQTVEKTEETPFYSWDKMEALFDEQVARTLNRLGMASRKDIQNLHDQLDALDKEIAKLATAKTPKPRVHNRSAKTGKSDSAASSPLEPETPAASDRPSEEPG